MHRTYKNGGKDALRFLALGAPWPVLRRAIVSLALALISPAVSAEDWIYTVRPGDNLWTISGKHLSNPSKAFKLQALNAIDDPYHIPPGTTIRVPLSWLQKKSYNASVISVRGEVERIPAAPAIPSPLEPGAQLAAGESIRTGTTGNVLIELANKSRVLLNADSQLRLETLDQYGASGVSGTKVRVVSGGLESKVTKRRQPATRFEIGTPAAVTAVRGTDYRVGVEEATQASRIEVVSGEVRVTGSRGSATLASGYGAIAKADGLPGAVTKLLPAPDLSGLQNVVDRVPIEFVLRKSLAERGWRAQIAPLADPGTFVFDQLEKGDRIHGPDIPDGRYVLSVRLVDQQGLEGLNAEHVFTLKARPEAPVLVYPPQDAVISEERATFRWAKNERAAAYHFQLARAAQFSDVLVDIPDLSETGAATEHALQPGFYHWRVAAKNVTEGVGPYTDAQRFRVPPPGPRPDPPVLFEREIAFRWRSGEPGQQYEFQLARDAAFAELLAQTTSVEPEAKVSRPEEGRYYLRVRTIDVDGYRGPYGTPQTLDVPPLPPPPWLWLVLFVPFAL